MASSIAIQLMYCSPLPTGPPAPRRKGGSMVASAPPAGAQHDAEAQVDDADAARRGGLRGRLPFAHDVGEEAGAGGAVLVDHVGVAVAVVADRRGGDQRLRRAVAGR